MTAREWLALRLSVTCVPVPHPSLREEWGTRYDLSGFSLLGRGPSAVSYQPLEPLADTHSTDVRTIDWMAPLLPRAVANAGDVHRGWSVVGLEYMRPVRFARARVQRDDHDIRRLSDG